jgi:3-oxoacyl-[acyl-carrier-protein] synthase II
MPRPRLPFRRRSEGFNVEEYIPAKEARGMDTFIHYGIAAGVQALRDSGLEVNEANAERIGVLVGSGIGGLPMIEDTHQTYVERGRAGFRRSSCRVRSST